MTENKLMEFALKYAEKGWYVFPCREVAGTPFERNGMMITPKVKSPYYKGGFKTATTNSFQIMDWWTRTPEACIGISCEPSNLVCVDIDMHNGKNGFENFMRLGISTEGALHSLTPSGGMHILYNGLTNSEANVTIGVDLRSRGAYFIAPPSYVYDEIGDRHYYQFIDDFLNQHPSDVSQSLIEKLNAVTGKHQPKKKKEYTGREDTHEELYEKARGALTKLPKIFCDEYFRWVNVGLALKEGLGDDGFILWDEWSRQSDKYEEGACAYRWERFEPREITISSLFFWAGKGDL